MYAILVTQNYGIYLKKVESWIREREIKGIHEGVVQIPKLQNINADSANLHVLELSFLLIAPRR